MPGHIQLARLRPAMPAAYYKSYSVRYPLSTHWRLASCDEVYCLPYQRGWETFVDTGDDLGRMRYDYLVQDKNRACTMEKTGPTTYTFRYAAGTPCFEQLNHRLKIPRAPLFLVTGGDWRGNPRGTEMLVHGSGENWAEDFAAHQGKINKLIERG